MIIIYTDGACKGNPGNGGYGVVLISKNYRKEFSSGYRLTTNNRMELLSVIVALESLKNKDESVLVYSDSKYVVNVVEKKWVFSWEKKSFDKKKNPDLWIRFLKVYRKHHVRFEWVKGHSNIKENDRCDDLAVKASEAKVLDVDVWYENNVVGGNTLF